MQKAVKFIMQHIESFYETTQAAAAEVAASALKDLGCVERALLLLHY